MLLNKIRVSEQIIGSRVWSFHTINIRLQFVYIQIKLSCMCVFYHQMKWVSKLFQSFHTIQVV